MSTKSKGTNAERELIHKLWASGFAAIRSAGSGSMRYPSPDILAAKNGRTIAVECKITKDSSKYLEKQEIEDLEKFASIFNAEPSIAVKFKGEDWYFLGITDLKETDKSFMVDVELAKIKGKSFESFI
jgi:Holliday junction resolvase